MPTRRTSAAKVSGLILAALAVLGGGYGGFEGILSLQARQEATDKSMLELKQRHDADMQTLRDDVKGLSEGLNALVVQGSHSCGQLELLINMVRDHTQGERK